MDDKEWLPDEEVARLTEERHFFGESSTLTTAERMVNEAAPFAIRSIEFLASYSQNERVRLAAATYLVDRAMGRIPEAKTTDRAAAWEELIGAVVINAEQHANGSNKPK